MWVKRLAAPVLSLLLLLSSTAGLVAHDHATSIDLGAVDCAIDHDRAHGATPASGPVVAAAGEHHAHDCVGCHFAGSRVLAAVASSAAGSLGSDAARFAKPESLPRIALAWTGRTLRGPPSA